MSDAAKLMLERCNIYIFFRKNENGEDMFYPIELRDDEDACQNAECNPGTIRVEHVSGRLVWQEDTSNE